MVKVVFKKWGNDTIMAVFPFEKWSYYELTSYEHIGQHSGCHWQVPYTLKNATPTEYADLLKEIEGIYGKVQVLKRMPSTEKVCKVLIG